MQVTVDQRAQLLTTISQAFRNAGLSTRVIGDETSTQCEFNHVFDCTSDIDSSLLSIAQFVSEAPNWLSTTVGSAIAAVVHHQYGFVDGPTQLTMANQARSLSGGDQVWATEICCEPHLSQVVVYCTHARRYQGFASSSTDPTSSVSYGSEYDPTMLGGLRMANLIYQSLGNAQENHWYVCSCSLGTRTYIVIGTGGQRFPTKSAIATLHPAQAASTSRNPRQAGTTASFTMTRISPVQASTAWASPSAFMC